MSLNISANDVARMARLESFVQSDPSNISLLAEAFDCALEIGAWESAQGYLTVALGLQPDDASLRHRQALLWIAEKRYDRAELLLTGLLTEGPRSPTILFNLAFVKFRQHDYAAARDVLQPLIGNPEAPAQTPSTLLRCYHHLGEFDQATALIGQLQKMNALDVTSMGVASLMYFDANEVDKARGLSEATLKLDPHQTEALVARGTVALGERNVTGARKLLSHALDGNPNEGRVWSACAMASLLEGNYDRALTEYETAVSLLPNHIGTWHGKAWANIAKRDWAAAQKDFETALALDRNFSESHGGLAVVLAQQGRTEEAKASITRALKLDPQSLAARYAEAILSGVASDQVAFRRFAERILAGRSRPDSAALAHIFGQGSFPRLR